MMSFLGYTTALQAKLAGSAVFTIFLISSCSDPATVGLELAPGNNQIGVFYEEFVLDAQMVLVDSVNTTNSGVLVVGHETDDFFGSTESTGFSRLYIDAAQVRPTADAVLDSMFFNMDVVSVNGSALDQPKNYSIHKLIEPIQDTVYYNFDAIPFEENSFAAIEVTFGEVKDTVLKFPVAEEFQEELFGKMKSGSEFSSLINFREYFPGIAVKAKEGDNTAVSIAVGGASRLTAYYHNSGDTVAKSYLIASYPSRSFNGVKSDRSGTPTEVVAEYGESYDVGPVVGMKSMLTMALRIDTSPLDAFLDTLSGVTFNQASFTIGPIENQDEDNNPIDGMMMKFVDQNNNPLLSTLNNVQLYVQTDLQPQVLLDGNGDKVPNNTYNSAAELEYDSEDKIYVAGVTSHVNAIYRGDLLRQNWLLQASKPDSRDDFKRSLRQFKTDKSKIVLKIIYSKSK